MNHILIHIQSKQQNGNHASKIKFSSLEETNGVINADRIVNDEKIAYSNHYMYNDQNDIIQFDTNNILDVNTLTTPIKNRTRVHNISTIKATNKKLIYDDFNDITEILFSPNKNNTMITDVSDTLLNQSLCYSCILSESESDGLGIKLLVIVVFLIIICILSY